MKGWSLGGSACERLFCFPPTLRKDSFQGLTPLEEGRVEATERL